MFGMAETPAKSAARQRRNVLYRDPDEPASELFRAMPPRRPKPGEPRDLAEALRAAKVGHHELREALDAAKVTDPGTPDPRKYEPAMTSQSGGLAARQRRWAAHLQQALTRVDVWILIATIALVVLAYLTLVKTR
jgi:hypothetical protein